MAAPDSSAPAHRRLAWAGGVLACLLLAGCNSGPAPVIDRARAEPPTLGYHLVHAGDTLYSIAWRYGLDWQQLARANGIAAPYRIQPGQKLQIPAQAPVLTRARVTTGVRVSAAPGEQGEQAEQAEQAEDAAPPPTQKVAAPASPAAVPATPVRSARADPLRWHWPLEGEVVRGFALTGKAINKGLDIRGAPGAAVGAAARGQVVYAGTGLRGYRQLVIMKHDDTWLSAYAHNDKILVREGQVLAAGEQVAQLAAGGEAQPLLHFEIRRRGEPMNPMALLPRRPASP